MTSTDAQVLTAAREYHAACQAVKEAAQLKARADQEAFRANTALNDANKRATECKTRLEQVAAMKPAEPAARPPQPMWATEPPKNMVDAFAATSDADTPAVNKNVRHEAPEVDVRTSGPMEPAKPIAVPLPSKKVPTLTSKR